MKYLLTLLLCPHFLLATTITIQATNSATSADTSITTDATSSETIISNQLPNAGSNGTTATVNVSGNTINNKYPQLFINEAGNGVAAWACIPTTSIGSEIFATLYDATTATWSAPTFLGLGASPIVGMDLAGDAFVAWVDNFQIFVIRYNATTGKWDTDADGVITATQLSSSTTTSDSNSYPSLSVNDNGVAVVAWLSYANGSTVPAIYISGFDGTSWSTTPTLVTPVNSLDIVSPPIVSIDSTAITPGPVLGQLIWLDAAQAGIVYSVEVIVTTP